MKVKNLNMSPLNKLWSNLHLWLSFVTFKMLSFIDTLNHEFNVSFKLLLWKFAIESNSRANIALLMWAEIHT